jgi:hypothetical protein
MIKDDTMDFFGFIALVFNWVHVMPRSPEQLGKRATRNLREQFRSDSFLVGPSHMLPDRVDAIPAGHRH